MNETVVAGYPKLSISVNKPVIWMGYSIDGQANKTITGNTTIREINAGMHNVTVYAQDEYGNIGTSETIHFTVKASIEPILGLAVVGAVGALGFLVYYKWRLTKRKR